MNEQQAQRSLRLLAFFADGCVCWERPDLKPCFMCQARDLLKEMGWKQDARGWFVMPPAVEHSESRAQFFMVERTQLDVLRALAKRLHTETRMDGNAMRDAGHAVEAIVRVAEQLEVPEGTS